MRMKLVGGLLTLIVYTVIALAVAYALVHFEAHHYIVGGKR